MLFRSRKMISVGEILKMEPGSIVGMTRSAGENVDIIVSGTVIGYGEIVIIEDAMGIRLTDFKNEE